jgi:hypothetical protein
MARSRALSTLLRYQRTIPQINVDPVKNLPLLQIHRCNPFRILNGTVATSRVTTNLNPTSHTATEILDDVGKVADSVAVGNEVPTTGTVAVVVEP